MRLSITLAALAGVAIAAPKSQPRQRMPEERASSSRIHRPNQRVDASPDKSVGDARPEYSQNWAGAVKHSQGITKVSGTIKVPRASGGSQRQSGAAWVGIDGDSCGQSLLQTGIDFYGDGSYDAWYEWFPDNVIFFDDFPLSIGDEIFMEVDASSKTVGTTTLENLTTGKKTTYTFHNPPAPLCETDADWIVEQFDSELAGFTDIVFTNNTAVTASGNITPAGGDVIDIKVNGQIKTDCGLDGDDVYCRYTGRN